MFFSPLQNNHSFPWCRVFCPLLSSGQVLFKKNQRRKKTCESRSKERTHSMYIHLFVIWSGKHFPYGKLTAWNQNEPARTWHACEPPDRLVFDYFSWLAAGLTSHLTNHATLMKPCCVQTELKRTETLQWLDQNFEPRMWGMQIMRCDWDKVKKSPV